MVWGGFPPLFLVQHPYLCSFPEVCLSAGFRPGWWQLAGSHQKPYFTSCWFVGIRSSTWLRSFLTWKTSGWKLEGMGAGIIFLKVLPVVKKLGATNSKQDTKWWGELCWKHIAMQFIPSDNFGASFLKLEEKITCPQVPSFQRLQTFLKETFREGTVLKGHHPKQSGLKFLENFGVL